MLRGLKSIIHEGSVFVPQDAQYVRTKEKENKLTFQYAFKKGDKVFKKGNRDRIGIVIGRKEETILGIHYPEIYSVKWQSGEVEPNIAPGRLEKKHVSR